MHCLAIMGVPAREVEILFSLVSLFCYPVVSLSRRPFQLSPFLIHCSVVDGGIVLHEWTNVENDRQRTNKLFNDEEGEENRNFLRPPANIS